MTDKNLIIGGVCSSPKVERYNSLNGLRAYAALGILLMHYLANIDAEMCKKLQNSGILYSDIIPFFTSFVYMFFIVSAFSMCCGYCEQFNMIKVRMPSDKTVLMSRFNAGRFYSKRYSRIWPFFALLVLIDVIMNPSCEELYQAFADLTLAFNLLPNPEIKVIGVGWFLGVVFLFYMIFPWFVFLLQNKVRAWSVMAIAVIFHVVLVRYFLTDEFCTESQISSPRHNIVYSFPFFMVGGLIYIYRTKIKQFFENGLYQLILLVISIVATGAIFTSYRPMIFGEVILYQLIVFILWVMYAVSGGFCFVGFKVLDNKVVKFLSELSMEIYLCHMVMFRCIEKLHIDKYIQNPHLYYWTYCIWGIILAIIFSYVVKNKIFPICSRLMGRTKS